MIYAQYEKDQQRCCRERELVSGKINVHQEPSPLSLAKRTKALHSRAQIQEIFAYTLISILFTRAKLYTLAARRRKAARQRAASLHPSLPLVYISTYAYIYTYTLRGLCLCEELLRSYIHLPGGKFACFFWPQLSVYASEIEGLSYITWPSAWTSDATLYMHDAHRRERERERERNTHNPCVWQAAVSRARALLVYRSRFYGARGCVHTRIYIYVRRSARAHGRKEGRIVFVLYTPVRTSFITFFYFLVWVWLAEGLTRICTYRRGYMELARACVCVYVYVMVLLLRISLN